MADLVTLPGFAFHEVATGLWVGPCPNSPERIRAVRAAGITSLVSVQTDWDLTAMGMDWQLLWRFLMAQGISAQRLPIEDFDERALAKGLSQAVEAVRASHAAGRGTYVHCTAGVNRSPTVAIGYLVATGLDLDTAWEQVTSRHPCAPNRGALERWLEARR